MSIVSRSLPNPKLADGSVNPSERRNGYGEVFVVSPSAKVYPFADEGGYFSTLSPTPGTGIAGHAAPTTFDNTKPFVLIKNADAVGGKSIYLDYIKLTETVAGAGGTLNYATHALDAGAGYTSGGSALSPVSPNLNVNTQTVAVIYAGAVVATAGGSQRVVSNQRRRTVIPVVGDVCIFDFGASAIASGMPTEGTTELERVFKCPPVIIAPGGFYKLVLWRGSQSGADSLEVEIGHWER